MAWTRAALQQNPLTAAIHSDIWMGMNAPSPGKCAACWRTVARPAGLLLATLCLFLGIRLAAAQQSHKPLSEKDVINLLTNDVRSDRVGAFAKEFGITFQVTPDVEKELREAGATDELIGMLKALAPNAPAQPPEAAPPAPNTAQTATPVAPSPPVLIVESSQGNAQVYVDDEPIATTSPEGRLKLTKLSAGEHLLRVSLTGFKDFEQIVRLNAGETTRILAVLEAPVAARPSPPKPSAEPAPAAPPKAEKAPPQPSASGSGTLGLFLRPETGGMVITAVVPGSSAEKAGLRRGYRLYSVADRTVANVQDVPLALANHPPGSSVEVTYGAGPAVMNARLELGASDLYLQLPHFFVRHDHGPPTPNYCTGWMYVVGDVVLYVGVRGVAPGNTPGRVHNLEIPVGEIREAGKNDFYLAPDHAFHIRLKQGLTNYNFIVLDSSGHPQQPDAALEAIHQAMHH
jgi:PEGA domain/PDZ domain